MSQNSKFLQIILGACEIDSKHGSGIENIDDVVECIFAKKFPALLESTKKTDSDIKINIPNEYVVNKEDGFWIFGYGSLIWKADFPYITRRRGYIRGYERKFYQNSIDHRGTPQQPGRVVTLVVASENNKVYGMAYKIAKSDQNMVLNHLDYREKNGYERCSLRVLPYPISLTNNISDEEINAITYIATHNNDSYAGHVSEENAIAEQIYNAVGTSGTNREYVFKLSKAMKFLFSEVDDNHLFQLEKILRRKEDKTKKIAQYVQRDIRKILDNLEKIYIEKDSFEMNNFNSALSLIQHECYDDSYLLN